MNFETVKQRKKARGEWIWKEVQQTWKTISPFQSLTTGWVDSQTEPVSKSPRLHRIFFFSFSLTFLLRLPVYPMYPHVIRGIVLERASYIQYGCRKRGTHARVFSRTLAHGNSKIEIRQLKMKGKKARRNEWIWREAQWARKVPST